MDSSLITETPAAISPEVKRKKSTFAADVMKLASGTTIAQGLTVIASPLLTRLYVPDAFGLLALFTSITGILKAISCLRYELAIVLPQSDEEGANVLGGSLLVVILVTGLSTLAVILGKTPLLRLLKAADLAPFLWLVPLTTLIGGVFLALNHWNTRTKQFGRLSIAQVVSALVVTGAQLGLGYVGYATGGSLIGASVLGAALVTMVLGGQIWRDDGVLFLRSIRWRHIAEQLKRYRKFPQYDAWAILLNNISWQLPAFLLAAFFSKTEVGYYALSFRVLKLPMALIGTAIGQVFFQRAAEAKNEGKLAVVVESNFRRLVILGLLPFLLLTIVGKDLFTVIFGQSWSEAGVYTQILSIWIFFWFISSPMSTLFRVLERQEFSLVLNITIFVSRFVALGIGGLIGNARLALFLFAISGVFLYGYLSFSIMNAAGVAWLKITQILGKNFLTFIPLAVMLIVIKLLNLHLLVELVVACLYTGVYMLYHGLVTFEGLKYLKKRAIFKAS